jgi:CSLREA domain-containing protein
VPLKTIALLPGSPAIDKGVRNDLTTDQRGQPRPFNYANIPPAAGGDNSDIGAFEANNLQLGPSLIVTTTNDHDDGGCSPVDCTLREAITAANNLFGDNVILFAPAVTGTVQLTGALPTLSSNIDINGPGAAVLTVRRNTGGDYRIFTIGDAISPGPAVHLSGLTLANGRMTSGGFPFGGGGGVANLRGTLTLSYCTLSDNHTSGTFGLGGGIFSYEGPLIVRHCTLSGNSARYAGGGIVNAGTSTSGTLTIDNSLLNANSSAGRGGGIFNLASGGDADFAAVNCTLSANSAASGGGIENYADAGGAANATLTNCTLSGNSASNGGGINNFNDNANPGAPVLTLRNNILKAGGSGANLLYSGGVIISQGHNLSSDAAGGDGGTGQGGYLNAGGDKRNTDPKLGPLTNNGGLTKTHALLLGSPAIDQGAGLGNTITTDQRGVGFLRVVDDPAIANVPGGNGTDIGAFEFGAHIDVVSRKLHNGTPHDIKLSFGSLGIECRSGGASGAHQVKMTFPGPVTVGGVSVASSDGHATASASVSNQIVTIDLNNVTNAQTLTITLIDLSDGTTTNDLSFQMGVLWGDVNFDGYVLSGDYTATRQKSGSAVNNNTFQFDVNPDGFILSGDYTAVRRQSGTHLP